MKRSEAVERGVELQKAGRVEEARNIYRQILAETPDHASSLHLLGVSYLDQPDWREGVALIERAIALQPQTPVFHYNLGVGYRQHGEFERARACFRAAIDRQQDYGEAWSAWVATHRYSEGGEDLATILAQLERPLEDDNRRFFHFAAGKILDDIGDYDAAFEQFRRGNALHPGGWNSAGFHNTCEAVRELFTPQLFAERAGWGRGDARPIFVVGMPRSGSSLAEQILASHPQVAGVGELNDIPAIVTEMAKRMRPPQPYPAFIPYMPAEVFTGYAGSYLARVSEMAGSEALRPVDKMLANFLHLGVIRLLFPGAKIIHSRRNPLDTCLSCFFQNFARKQEFSFDLHTLRDYLADYRRLMQHWHTVLPDQVFDLDYEQLVAEPEASVRELLAFCELPWDERCLDFAGTERRVTTASSWQVRQPLYASSVGRWRHYQNHLGPLMTHPPTPMGSEGGG